MIPYLALLPRLLAVVVVLAAKLHRAKPTAAVLMVALVEVVLTIAVLFQVAPAEAETLRQQRHLKAVTVEMDCLFLPVAQLLREVVVVLLRLEPMPLLDKAEMVAQEPHLQFPDHL